MQNYIVIPIVIVEDPAEGQVQSKQVGMLIYEISYVNSIVLRWWLLIHIHYYFCAVVLRGDCGRLLLLLLLLLFRQKCKRI
jgi:hypothetical protein